MVLVHLTQLAIDYSYNYTTTATDRTGGTLIGLTLFLFVLSSVGPMLGILMLVSFWRVFAKAGRPGWAAVIPIYNSWKLAEIAGKPGWFGLLPLLAVIPVAGWIAAIVVWVMIGLGVARNFGKSDTFGVVGLCIFPFVGYPVLAFGSATYHSPQASDGASTPPSGSAAPHIPSSMPPSAASPMQ